MFYLAEGQWNQGGGGVQPGGEQSSTQVTIPKDVSSIEVAIVELLHPELSTRNSLVYRIVL